MVGLVYLDESGDHSMDNVDPASPVFCLALALFTVDDYVQRAQPAVTDLKMKYFGHDGVVLRSYDIRKNQGPFQILQNKSVLKDFMADMNDLMGSDFYELIAVAIRKDRHAAKYHNPAHPYDFAMEMALERLIDWAEVKQLTEVRVIAEGRGAREDAALEAEFWRVISNGTSFRSRVRFRAVDFRFHCVTKATNLPGHQLADLAAYAVARHTRDPVKMYPPFQVVHPRLFKKNSQVLGYKVFP